jgi:phosphoglycolate phosphatase-like HAD superfamily hydrolase
MKFQIFLFDIDGTLIKSGHAGSTALNQAFFETLNIEGGMDGVVCDGKTDPAIVREVLQSKGFDFEKNVAQVFSCYMKKLATTVKQSQNYQVLSGVYQCLDFLESKSDLICGLATGNLEEGARIKLARGDLNKYFPIGGFGSDYEKRHKLVQVALERGRKQLQDRQANGVIIGDTPLDVHAAHRAGLPAVGVTTGNFNREQLETAGADLVVDDLSQPSVWIERLESLADAA